MQCDTKPTLAAAALKRAAILHASAAWGSDSDAILMQALVKQNAELRGFLCATINAQPNLPAHWFEDARTLLGSTEAASND